MTNHPHSYSPFLESLLILTSGIASIVYLGISFSIHSSSLWCLSLCPIPWTRFSCLHFSYLILSLFKDAWDFMCLLKSKPLQSKVLKGISRNKALKVYRPMFRKEAIGFQFWYFLNPRWSFSWHNVGKCVSSEQKLHIRGSTFYPSRKVYRRKVV